MIKKIDTISRLAWIFVKSFDSRRLKSAFFLLFLAIPGFSLEVRANSFKECIRYYGSSPGFFSGLRQRWVQFIEQKQPDRKVKAIFNSSSSVQAMWNDEDLVLGDFGSQVRSAIRVLRSGSQNPKYYNRTNRGFKSLNYFYPKSKLLPSEMEGKKVLDLAMGGGRYVQELNLWGVEAYGLDIALSSAQLNDIYIGLPTRGADGLVLSRKLGQGIFIQADATRTGLASNQFDIIFSTYGMFEYEIGIKSRDQFLLDILQELKRILKVGGVIRISPLFKNKTDLYLKKLVDQIEGLQITEMGPSLQSSRPNVVYAEITKIHE